MTLTTIDHQELEADVTTADADQPVRGAVVIAHPHPLYGGDRFNPVVDAIFEALPRVGFHSLRFDFRGVGNSSGEHDGGEAERLDVAAAVDFLAGLHDDIWIVGYSFGSIVALDVIEPRVSGWIAVAPPLTAMRSDVLAARDPRPKLVLAAEHDQFTPSSSAQPIVDSWTNATLESIANGDHFLAGRTRTVADAAARWLTSR
ncbi:MAG: hypothetical protein B7C54_07005 [Acidimicrobiales bacterium mtb01]|nr:MAG: hypothetical protein B7C54_07005 [Acidimicrobiales bacterium mtb01]